MLFVEAVVGVGYCFVLTIEKLYIANGISFSMQDYIVHISLSSDWV